MLFIALFTPYHHQISGTTFSTTRPESTTTTPYNKVSTTPLLTSAATKPPTTKAPTPKPPYSPPIVEVAKVSFRGSIIRIFADAGVRNPSRFFYEPLVHLDPKSIFAHHHIVSQENVVSFTIEMWNPELRRKVLARLQSLKGQHFNVTDIGEEDIYVLPFEEVLLNRINLTISNPAVKVDNHKGGVVSHQSYIILKSTLKVLLSTKEPDLCLYVCAVDLWVPYSYCSILLFAI